MPTYLLVHIGIGDFLIFILNSRFVFKKLADIFDRRQDVPLPCDNPIQAFLFWSGFFFLILVF